MAAQCLQGPLFLFVCCLFVESVNLESVKIKIVDEPAVYRGVNSFYQQHQQSASNAMDLEPRVDPISFSGPPHFSVLNGKCFSLIENSYKYELCPFHNVTQREQTVRWNAFSGILGLSAITDSLYHLKIVVFQGWDIVNNTFVDMLMDEGDYCPGNNPRQTKVLFKCGNDDKLISVSEPATCRYKMNFETPLACPMDALLVYPVLSSDGKSRWESIEEGLWRDELTRQGYNKQRKQLFISEGLIASGETKKKEKLTKRKGETEKKNEDKKTRETMPFSTLELCSQAYKELQSDIKRLRKQLSQLNNQSINISGDTITKLTQSVLTTTTTTRKENIQYLNTKRNKPEENTDNLNEKSNITKSVYDTVEFQKFEDAAKVKGKILKHRRNLK